MKENIKPKEEYGIVSERVENGRKIRRVRSKATPVNGYKEMVLEFEEEEVRPGWWKKILGSEKWME